jgi:hypothetical protein
MRLARWLRHVLGGEWIARRAFTPDVLQAVEAAIGEH